MAAPLYAIRCMAIDRPHAGSSLFLQETTAANMDKPTGYTKLKQWQKQEAVFWKQLGYDDPGKITPHAGLINLRCSNITDQDVHFLLNRLTHIDELDLKEALITNEGVKLLSRLPHIGILYLKDCPNLDNDCVPYLNRLHTLKELSVASTEVDITGVLKLDQLIQLETLQFSTPVTNQLYEQMLLLAQQHQGCTFYVNGGRYDIPVS
jgi:hypothetical protein